MKELKREIERVRTINRSQLNEDTTQTAIVLPLLSALGWKISDPEEVYMERHTSAGQADIALSIQGEDVVFIETKPARNKDLADDDKQQLLNYCVAAGVQVGVATNGLTWYLYPDADAESTRIDHAEPINLAENETDHEIEQIAEELARYLSKGAFGSGAHGKLRDKKVDGLLVKKWDGLLQGGHKKLVAVLRKEMKDEGISLPYKRVENFVQQRSSTPANDGSDKKKASTRAFPRKKERSLSRMSGGAFKKPSGVRMFGQTIKYSSGPDMLEKFLVKVNREDSEHLAVLVKRVNAVVEGEAVRRKANVKRSWRPRQIAETDIWVKTNYNPSAIVGLCEKILKVLGLPEDKFQLIP